MAAIDNNPNASVARGLAVVAALTSLFLVGWHLRTSLQSAAVRRTPACLAPIEVSGRDGSRLGCASEASGLGCAGASTGDRLELAAGACRLSPEGMSARMRLAQGLPIDVNAASAQDLELVEGIGPKLARGIVEDRERNGRFGSVAELDRVRGIGAAKLASLGRHLSASGEAR